MEELKLNRKKQIPMDKKALLLLLAALALFLNGCGRTDVAEAESPQRPVIVEAVETEEIRKELEISGNVKPSQMVRAGFKVEGLIEHSYVEAGDRVEAGQRLMRLETQDYDLNVDATLAKYEALRRKADSAIPSKINQAQAQLDYIEAQYQRMTTLHEQGVVSSKDLEEVETKYTVAQNQYQEAMDAYDITEKELRQVERALDLAQSKLEDTVLTSPIAGTVLKTTFEAGETIAPGHPAVILGVLDTMEVEIGVPDTIISRIAIGESVSVYLYGLDQEVEGKITNIDPMADQKTRTFGVQIEIDNSQGQIRPGMLAKVSLASSEVSAIMVPVNCVNNLPEASFLFVYKEDGTVEQRTVELGEIYGDRIQVLGGLEEGEEVVIDGQYQLTDGQTVTARKADAQ